MYIFACLTWIIDRDHNGSDRVVYSYVYYLLNFNEVWWDI